MNTICPYCSKPSELVSGQSIYPHRKDLYSKRFYKCTPCDAYVGCHPGTENPLGILANNELRKARLAAHKAFDLIWQDGHLTRTTAYKCLAVKLNKSKKDCHIALFDLETCLQVIPASIIIMEKLNYLIETLND